MVFVFTGNGKGKTTAAIGQAVRAMGHGKRMVLIQFIKSKDWPSGEEAALKKFGKQALIYKGGNGFVGIMGDSLPRSAHKAAARNTLEGAKKLINSEKFGIVILDEINIALALKLVGLKEVLAMLRRASNEIDIICTGRSAPKQLINVADLVTECREIKHPFQRGIASKSGIEY